jgi:hypothetical protein
LTTAVNPVKEWCRWKSRSCRGVIRKEVTYSDPYSVARSRAQIYSPFRPQFIPEGDEDGSVHWSTDNASLRKSLTESQPGPGGGCGARSTRSPSPSLYSGSSLANAKSDGGFVSANSLFSGSRPPSPSTVTTPSHHSVMSQDGYSVSAVTRLGLREHGWGQIEPASPFLYSNAKFDGRLVPLNPSLSRGRSTSCQTVALGRGRSVRKASPAPSKNTVL